MAVRGILENEKLMTGQSNLTRQLYVLTYYFGMIELTTKLCFILKITLHDNCLRRIITLIIAPGNHLHFFFSASIDMSENLNNENNVSIFFKLKSFSARFIFSSESFVRSTYVHSNFGTLQNIY